MVPGEHIKKKKDTTHKREDFVVPLLKNGTHLQQLDVGKIDEMPVLDLFGEPWMGEDQLRHSFTQMTADVDVFAARPRAKDGSILRVGEVLHSSSKQNSVESQTNRKVRSPVKHQQRGTSHRFHVSDEPIVSATLQQARDFKNTQTHTQ